MKSPFKAVILFLIVCTAAFTGCETLKSSKPIGTQIEYERMLVGRLDADYVGTENCLSACHSHDKIKTDFEASTMGAQMTPGEGMPLVNCESCHGPGSLAVKDLSSSRVLDDRSKGVEATCDFKSLIDLKELPAGALSLLCLKCHTKNATFNLHDWNAGEHANNDVSCSDCHRLHAGADLIVSPNDTAEMCFRCHQRVKAEFMMPSRHPVAEKKVFCTDCHDPHGTVNDNLLKDDSPKESCTRCHSEKEGPFIYEHADLTEDCTNCHRPHGSANNHLLKARPPFLCLQCHAGHQTASTSTEERKAAFYTNCTDCHTQTHGTDLPSKSGMGTFIK